MLRNDLRIAVLGGGPMGLAVAYQLALDGCRPIVFEADDRLGGMSASFDFDGLDIERYYHFHCLSDTDFLQLIGELGLSDKLHWVDTQMGYWYLNRLQAWGSPTALLRFKGLGPVAKLRYGLHAFLATRRNDWRDLDGIEATAWIRRWVGEEAYAVLWRKLFDYKFYELAGDVSAAWIWARIRRIGRSRQSLFRERLGYLEGGSRTLLDAMANAVIARGGEIRLSRPVSKVVIESGQLRGLTVQGEFVPFDKVVSTVPLPYVPALMPDLPQEVLARFASIKNIAVVCVIAKLRLSVTPNFWVNTNDDAMDIPGLVEYSNLRPLSAHVVYVPFYMPGENPKFSEPDEVFAAKVVRYLKRMNPALTDADFLAVRVSRYRHAQPVCGPGFLERLPPAALPVEGVWAADTSYYYPEDRGISESIKFGRKLARMACR